VLFGVDIASISAFAFLSDFCSRRSAKSDSACLQSQFVRHVQDGH